MLTEADFTKRRDDLTRGVALAQAEYENEAFKQETGSGSAAATAKAKEHLDALQARLNGLGAAWTANRKASADRNVAIRRRQFADFVGEVDGLLAKRKAALDDAEAAARKLCNALTAYANATSAIQQATRKAPNRAGHADRLAGLQIYLTSQTAPMLARSLLRDVAGPLQMSGADMLRDTFPNGDPEAFESLMADRIRGAAATFAPED